MKPYTLDSKRRGVMSCQYRTCAICGPTWRRRVLHRKSKTAVRMAADREITNG